MAVVVEGREKEEYKQKTMMRIQQIQVYKVTEMVSPMMMIARDDDDDDDTIQRTNNIITTQKEK